MPAVPHGKHKLLLLLLLLNLSCGSCREQRGLRGHIDTDDARIGPIRYFPKGILVIGNIYGYLILVIGNTYDNDEQRFGPPAPRPFAFR